MKAFARASWFGLVVALALVAGLRSGHAETRFALVIGNADYRTGALATPANDAGLVADALTAAGFTVTGAANLDQNMLRETFREFIDQVSAAGPDAVALVYLSGYGVQFNGDNFYIPVDADIRRDSDVPLQAVRISDFTQALAALPARVKIVILDAARQNPFAGGRAPLASGLALVDPVSGMAFAFNAAPGTVGPNEPGPYGAYASALTEMIAAGGLSFDDLFARVRLRVSELTQGAEIPWYVSGLHRPFVMTELAPGAPPPPQVISLAEIRRRPLRDFGNADAAYAAVLALDTMRGYEEFLALYPDSPYAQRVAAMLAVRREELIWRRCVVDDTPPAYWSYLRRYPHGPHAWDARRRLAILRAAEEPPATFVIIDFGVPPPPPAELVFVDRPIVIFVERGWAPPPPPPIVFVPPRPHEFAVLPPPPPPLQHFALPLPQRRIVPVFVKPPPTVTVRPLPPGATGAGRTIPVSLPRAIAHRGAPGTPGFQHPPAGGPPAGPPTRRGPPPGRPVVTIKPPPPPPPPSHPPLHHPATVKPPPPPSHPPVQHPVTVKPPPPPSHPLVQHPVTVRPPPPPKPPACPPGKHPTPQGCK